MPILTRVQRNDLYQVAQRFELNPPLDSEVRTEQNSDGNVVDALHHRPTESYISFRNSGEKIWLEWWPKFRNGNPHGFADGWTEAILLTTLWAKEVKKNHEAPDLWSEAAKAHALTDAAADVVADNTPFSLAEIKLLRPKLDELQAYVESRQPLTPEQKAIVEGKFQYLLGAAKRKMGRIDWLNIAVSQLLQLFVQTVLPPTMYVDVMAQASALFTGIARASSKMLGSGRP